MTLRNTFQRDLVYSAAKELANHPTPEEIYVHVRKCCPNISKGTVYRNIGVLVEEGKLKRIEIPNAPDRVDFNICNHYHFFCKNCCRVYDIDMCFLDNIESMIGNPNGFIIESHDIVFKGLCPDCTH